MQGKVIVRVPIEVNGDYPVDEQHFHSAVRCAMIMALGRLKHRLGDGIHLDVDYSNIQVEETQQLEFTSLSGWHGT